MKIKTLFCLLLLSTFVNAQDSTNIYVTPVLLEQIINTNDFGKNIKRHPVSISEWHFDGDYSSERIYGSPFIIDSITGDTVGYRTSCTVPITFEIPLFSVLSNLDSSYDSLHYVRLINNQKKEKWKRGNLKSDSGIHFIGWPLNKLTNRYYSVSKPLFSKDGNTAIIMALHQTKMTDYWERNDRIFIFRKDSSGWSIIKIIKSKK
ncbi:MAG: hypothetical protein ACPGSL_07300 [Vicingaceae bacterium]